MESYTYIGDIDLSGGKVDITDPCYDKDVWCRMNEVEVKPGIYKCYADLQNFPFTLDGKTHDDHRIASLLIVHEEHDDEEALDLCGHGIGEIGVDAGLAGFFDNKPNFSDAEWEAFCDDLLAREKSLPYDDAKRQARCYERSEFGFSGVVSSSGFGDGGYTVFAGEDEDGKIFILEIDFIEFR